MSQQPRDKELEKRIDAYVKGRMTEQEGRNLWVELLKRPDYIDLLETELAVRAIIEEKISSEGAEQNTPKQAKDEAKGVAARPVRMPWKWVAVAAGIAALLVAVNFFIPKEEPSLQQLALSEINLVENLESSPVVRSQKSELPPADSLLNVGYKAAVSGNITGAVRAYEDVIARNEGMETVAKAYLNLGIIRYNMKRYESASASFGQVIDDTTANPILKEKAYWYQGNAYLKLDDLPKARQAIQKTYSLDGIYRNSARRLLHRIDRELSANQKEH